MVKRLLGNERVMVIEELQDIAVQVGLSKSETNRFIKFAIAWYNDSGKRLWVDKRYGREWAERFYWEKEYFLSDEDRIRLLIKVDGMKSARSRLAKQLVRRGGWDKKKAVEIAKKLTAYGGIRN